MATCPRCGGHLADGHRCSRRIWLVWAVFDWFVALVIGGALGALALGQLGGAVFGDYLAIPGAFVGFMVALAVLRRLRGA